MVFLEQNEIPRILILIECTLHNIFGCVMVLPAFLLLPNTGINTNSNQNDYHH